LAVRWDIPSPEVSAGGIITTLPPAPLPADPLRPCLFTWKVQGLLSGTALDISTESFVLVPKSLADRAPALLVPRKSPGDPLLLASALLMLGRAEEALLALDSSPRGPDVTPSSYAAGLRRLAQALQSGETWAFHALVRIWIPE
jgi:hypothetical protein